MIKSFRIIKKLFKAEIKGLPNSSKKHMIMYFFLKDYQNMMSCIKHLNEIKQNE
jgi:hypothetical protein